MPKLWGGRFTKSVSKLMGEFNDSLPFDKRLWKEEIEASKAYAAGLSKAGVFPKSQQSKIARALTEIGKELANGKFKFKPEDEDIHTAIERRLVEKVGAAGKKIHTGRSRNEQVSTDERIFLKSANIEAMALIQELQFRVRGLAVRTTDDILPSYTHLQQAQLIRLGHYFMSLFFMLENDRRRFKDLEKRIDVLPLGSGAVAGSTIKLDRELLRRDLGFSELSPNSITAVSDRDFINDFLFAAAQTLIHLSRYAEDLIMWSSTEFSFVELDDAYSTGSSMMPQKKNPDSLELIRGKVARAIANLNALLTLQKGLPLTYSKDLQEDKEPLFDSVDTLTSSLRVFAGVISTLKIRRQNLMRNTDDSIYATDIADYLVEKGVPFRESHKIVGKLVLAGTIKEKRLRDFTRQELRDISELFDESYYKIFDPTRSVERHDVYGGTSLKRVREQIELAGKMLAKKKLRRR
jgi:argininosuccinate lyase